MGIGFLVPAFLAGLAALGIPLYVHLRHRDKDQPFRFPSLMFLEQLPIRTAQRQRVTDWPLLLLRALAVALLVFAFARPVFTSRTAAGADTRTRAVVLVVDRSMSMGYRGVLARALDSARAVVATLGARDRVGVVAFDDAAEMLQRLTEDKPAALGALSAVQAESRGTRLAPALRTARQMLLDAPYAAAEIVVISDMQRSGASGIAGLDLPTGVTLRGIDVGAAARPNSAVRVVEARRVLDGSRTLLAVKARVLSRELPQSRAVSAILTVNGREAARITSSLAADGESVLAFAPVPAPDGAVSGTVTLDTDALAADDTLHFVVPRDDALRVALVLPTDVRADETLYLERALAIGRAPAVSIERLRAAPASAADLARTAMIVFWDVVPSAAAIAALDPWVRNGGGITLVAGRRLASYTGELPFIAAKAAGLSDRLNDRGGTLREVRYEHPLFAPFREATDALSAVRALRYARLDVTGAADVLASFDDGLPAVVEQRPGNGRLLLLSMPLDIRAGDFPLQPAFLPFVRQLVMHGSGRDAVPLWRVTSESWSLPLAIADPVVRTPDGSLLRPTADAKGSAIPLADAGLYSAFAGSAAGAAGALLAVNAPAIESDLTPMDTTELLLGVRTGTTAADDAQRAAAPDAALSNTERERRQNPWRLLLMLVVVLLVIETVLATRGWRAVARRVTVVRPEIPSSSRSIP